MDEAGSERTPDEAPARRTGAPTSKQNQVRLNANPGGPQKGKITKGGARAKGSFWGGIKRAMEAQPAPRPDRPGYKPAPVTSVPESKPVFDRIGMFQSVLLNDTVIEFHFKKYPVAGAHAKVEIGGVHGRSTATRVALGSVIAPGIGTMIGFMAKKNTQNIYLSIDLADGQVIIVESNASNETKARKFAAKLNRAAQTG